MIFGVVSWKITDSMAYSSFTNQSSKATLDDKKETTSEENTQATTETNTNTADNNTAASGNTTANAGGKPAASTTTTNSTANNTQATTPTTNTQTTAPATPPTEFKVDIPSGSSGIAIAKILKEKGIISDTKMFITRVDQLKMGPKLKAGSFTIKSGSTLDDVIYILVGKKR